MKVGVFEIDAMFHPERFGVQKRVQLSAVGNEPKFFFPVFRLSDNKPGHQKPGVFPRNLPNRARLQILLQHLQGSFLIFV